MWTYILSRGSLYGCACHQRNLNIDVKYCKPFRAHLALHSILWHSLTCSGGARLECMLYALTSPNRDSHSDSISKCIGIFGLTTALIDVSWQFKCSNWHVSSLFNIWLKTSSLFLIFMKLSCWTHCKNSLLVNSSFASILVITSFLVVSCIWTWDVLSASPTSSGWTWSWLLARKSVPVLSCTRYAPLNEISVTCREVVLSTRQTSQDHEC